MDTKYLLSLGAGVQSSTLALMFEHGEVPGFPMPEAALFADTQSEPDYVYEWLDWLEKQLSYPVIRVSHGSLRDSMIASASAEKGRFAGIPLYVHGANGGREGMLRRQCTREYKVTPLESKVRELCGLEKGQRAPKNKILAVQYIGISLDEAQRMKPSQKKYLKHQWPLVDMNMRRLDCLTWMKERGYPLPKKSACTFCRIDPTRSG